MKTPFEINREHVYTLEFIRCEMELKRGEAIQKNKDFDSKGIDEKIKLVGLVQSYIYNEFEEMEKLRKKIFELEFLNQKLMAEISMLKNNRI